MPIEHSENQEAKMMLCDTIYFQGMNTSQTQALKYTVDEKITATTGETMWCEGRNHLPRLKVIYNLHIGKEISDVDLKPFKNKLHCLSPIKLYRLAYTRYDNWRNGFKFEKAKEASPESVKFHSTKFSQLSLGQETDIASHQAKYDSWLRNPNRHEGLILYGVSRGTAATFSSYTKHKYPEVKLVILEGAIDSIPNVMHSRVAHSFRSPKIASAVMSSVNPTIKFFKRLGVTSYSPDGVSPLSCVTDFPENVPVVFITSKIDEEVPIENTENISMALADRGKNDVYRLVLKHSTHPNYMFDNREDRDTYECFIHAIYKKYYLQHDETLAAKGEKIMQESCLFDMKEYALKSPALSLSSL